jgi:magnesium chelatase accessory protein
MSEDLDWERDGRGWPHHEASRFVEAAGLRWHVQQMGAGPVLLLLHGTGASTHSWRALMAPLARHFSVVAADLPGHGFTATPPRERLSLPGMVRELDALLRALGVSPALVVGHSAGAAILIRMALDGLIAPCGIVSLNGALLPFRGLARHVFGPLAKLLVMNPVVPLLFTWTAGQRSAERLIRDTGSALDAEGHDLYARLMRSPRHVAGALGMMANWDLDRLERDLPRLKLPLLLVAAGGDLAVPADVSFQVRDRIPGAKVEYLRGVGHLAHEERPSEVVTLLVDWARTVGALPVN